MLRLSDARLCSEHFAECDFVNFMAEYQMEFASNERNKTAETTSKPQTVA